LVLAVGNDRNLPAHHRSSAQLTFGEVASAIPQVPPSAEVVAVDHGDTVALPCVPIVVDDVDAVINDDRRVAAMAATAKAVAEPWPVPGIKTFARSKRHPADVPAITTAKTDPEAKTAMRAEAEKAHQRRTPAIRRVIRARVPAPTVIGMMEPAAIVIRGPTPRLVANPAPAIVVEPDPAAIAVRSPADGYARKPAAAVSGNVIPTAVAIEIVRSGNAAIDILIAFRLPELAVAALIPAVPIIFGFRSCRLELDVFSGAANDHRVALFQRLNPFRGGNMRFTIAHCDHDPVLTENFDPVSSFLAWPDRGERSLDVDIGFPAPQFAIAHHASFHLHAKAAIGKLRDVQLGLFMET
jgi:hypothetical protein